MTEERLSGALQENILTALCFDDDHCKLIRAAVGSPKLFESSVYREVAGHAMDFIDQYGEPIKEHLPDHLESILEGDDPRKAKSYRMLLENLFQSRDTVNGKYVVQELHKFVRQQNLRSAIVQAVEAMEDGRVDEAEVVLQKGLNTQAVSFERGLMLSKPEDIVKVFEQPEEEGFDLGIPALDNEGIIPRRKELMLLMAPRGKGKSWFLTHCAKMGIRQRWSGLIISLEMSEQRYAARFLQSFFSIGKRKAETMVSRLKLDEDGRLMDLIQEKMERPTMVDSDIKSFLAKKARTDLRNRKPLVIKAFPTKQATMNDLRAYLDGLERFEKFVPDFICVDYPDLFAMKGDAGNQRIEIGRIVEEIRGLCVERNMAGITVSQGNRASEKAQTVTGDMMAEDISKLATADNLLTLSQTPQEYALGLARVFVEKARNEEAKSMVLITQAIAMGQFCLDSVRIGQDYWNLIGDKEDEGERRGRRRQRDDEGD